MKKVFKVMLICFSILIIAGAGLMFFGKGKIMLPTQKKEVFEFDNKDEYRDALSVKDNKIVNESGEQVILKGLMIPEAQRLNLENKFNKKYFEGAFNCGGNSIRLPVHPEEWAKDDYYLWRYLDKEVSWAVENNKYAIIDLHFIGNIETGAGNEMKDVGMNPLDFSIKFWKAVADYFKDVPNVIFEIYNEPTSIGGEEWRVCAKSLVNIIRETGAKQLILVSGIDYAYDISVWEEEPLEDKNIAYTAHIFPNRSGFKNKFKKASEKLPMVVTEWGYIEKDLDTRQVYLRGDSESFGKPLIDFMAEHNIGWTACWYDDNFEPPMFYKGMKEKTDWGKFVLEELK